MPSSTSWLPWATWWRILSPGRAGTAPIFCSCVWEKPSVRKLRELLGGHSGRAFVHGASWDYGDVVVTCSSFCMDDLEGWQFFRFSVVFRLLICANKTILCMISFPNSLTLSSTSCFEQQVARRGIAGVPATTRQQPLTPKPPSSTSPSVGKRSGSWAGQARHSPVRLPHCSGWITRGDGTELAPPGPCNISRACTLTTVGVS